MTGPNHMDDEIAHSHKRMAEMTTEIESLREAARAMLAALKRIAVQRLSADIPDDEVDDADFAGAYDTMIEEARTAIAQAEAAGIKVEG